MTETKFYYTKGHLPITPVTVAEFDLRDLAGWLAFQSESIQAAFFNEFDVQFRTCTSHEDSLGTHNQCLAINKQLSRAAAFLLRQISTKEIP